MAYCLKRFNSPLLWLLLLCFAPLPAFDSTTQENILSPNGEGVTAEFDESIQEVDLPFEGAAGDIITLHTAKVSDEGAFSLLMTLLDPNGLELRRADTRGAYFFEWSLGPYTLPVDGIYTLRVSSFLPDNVITFFVTLAKRESPLIPQGGSVSGSLYPDASELPFVIEANAGDLILVSVTSMIFDPILTLNNAAGDQMAFDDDSGGNLNATIGPLEITHSGSYQLLVASYDGPTYGQFDIAYRKISPDLLQYGDTRSFTLADEVITLQFEARAGEVIALNLDQEVGETLPFEVSVSSPSLLAASTRASANPLTRGLDRIPLPVSDLYTIEIRPVEGGYQGDVQLHLEKVAENYLLNNGLSIRVSAKSPNATLYFRAAQTGIHHIRIIQQSDERYFDSIPFSLRFLQGDQVTSTFSATLDNIDALEVSFYLPQSSTEEMVIQLETDAASPVSLFFDVDILYGEG